MERFPVMQDGAAVGELLVERERGCTAFDVRCRPAGTGPWCAWAVGSEGELRLGVLEEAPRRFRFSERMTSSLGTLLRGEVRPSGGPSGGAVWQPAGPEALPRLPWLRRRLRGMPILCCREGGLLLLALPYEPERPFPLMELFCFARLRRVSGRNYLSLAFDAQGRPVF